MKRVILLIDDSQEFFGDSPSYLLDQSVEHPFDWDTINGVYIDESVPIPELSSSQKEVCLLYDYLNPELNQEYEGITTDLSTLGVDCVIDKIVVIGSVY